MTEIKLVMVDTLWKLLVHSHVTMDTLFCLDMIQQSVRHQDTGDISQYVEVTK